MSSIYLDAALQCSWFEGLTRHLLLILAHKVDATGAGTMNLKELLAAINRPRQGSISGALSTLRKAGVLSPYNRFQPHPFKLDLNWLQAHAYTPEQIKRFDYKARTRAWEDERLDQPEAQPEPPQTGKDKAAAMHLHNKSPEELALIAQDEDEAWARKETERMEREWYEESRKKGEE